MEAHLLDSDSDYDPFEPPHKKRKITESDIQAKTFKQKVNEALNGLTNVPQKYCVSGKIESAPTIVIFNKKVMLFPTVYSFATRAQNSGRTFTG